jgi:hypothetical protein
MSSNGDGPGGGSTASILVDQSVLRSWRAANSARPALGGRHDVPRADLSRAIASVRRVEKELDELWHAALVAGDAASAELLVDVSHALRRAARRLEKNPAIG